MRVDDLAHNNNSNNWELKLQVHAEKQQKRNKSTQKLCLSF